MGSLGAGVQSCLSENELILNVMLPTPLLLPPSGRRLCSGLSSISPSRRDEDPISRGHWRAAHLRVLPPLLPPHHSRMPSPHRAWRQSRSILRLGARYSGGYDLGRERVRRQCPAERQALSALAATFARPRGADDRRDRRRAQPGRAKGRHRRVRHSGRHCRGRAGGPAFAGRSRFRPGCVFV